MLTQDSETQYWQITTDDYIPQLRKIAWQEAMHKIYLSVQPHGSDPINGEISYKKTSLGLDFVQLSGSPQIITGDYPVRSESLWLAVIIRGDAALEINRTSLAFSPGCILYGSCGNIDHIRLDMKSHFEILTIEIPNTIFYKRLVNPLSIRAGVLSSEKGISKILYETLSATNDEIANISISKFRALDIALTELFLTSLADHAPLYNFSNHANAQAFQRVCDSIEEQLSNEYMSLETIAQLNHVSARYIQKLFQEAGLKFNQYIRERRIDLCKRDMANINYLNLSITEICFRWGFNDISYFSRVFSQQVGISPRGYREQVRKRL